MHRTLGNASAEVWAESVISSIAIAAGKARLLLVAFLAGLVLLGASPAVADDVPGEPVPSEPPPPVESDTQQPSSSVTVLPRRCVGDLVLPRDGKSCRVLDFGPSRPMVVVWGDSHSWQQTPAIIAAARAARHNLVTFQHGACPPMLLREDEATRSCEHVGQRALRFIKGMVRRDRQVSVVLGGYWHLYRTLAAAPDPSLATLSKQARLWKLGGERVFRVLRGMDVRTIGIGQQPTLGFGIPVPTVDLPRRSVMPDEATERRWLRVRVDSLVEPSSVLCDRDSCRTTVHGVATYLDAFHINPAVSGIFTPLYRRALRIHR